MSRTPKRGRSLAFAAVLAVFGVAALVTAGSLGGAIVGGLGAVGFFWLWSQKRGRSVVGEKCAACGDGVFVEHAAEICALCKLAVHARCTARHAAEAHGVSGAREGT